MQNERLCFIVENYDNLAAMSKQYQLFYYLEDKSIEMFDIKMNRIFLKRIKDPEIKYSSLYEGSEFTIYSRQYKVVSYGDEVTRRLFEQQRSACFAMILPPSYMNIGKIVETIQNNGFIINQLKMNKFNTQQATIFANIHNSKDVTPQLLISDYVIGMELIKENAIIETQKFINEVINKSIDNSKSQFKGPAMISPSTQEISQLENEFFFGLKHQPQLSNCSLLVIKPHIIESGKLGAIIDIVLNEGFEISSMSMIYLNKIKAENFFDVYKSVLQEYSEIINHLISGPIVALEIRQDNCVQKLRDLVGPHDPIIAQALRPHTLRAIFGIDRVKNVCHCTDLPEDGVLECEEFFVYM